MHIYLTTANRQWVARKSNDSRLISDIISGPTNVLWELRRILKLLPFLDSFVFRLQSVVVFLLIYSISKVVSHNSLGTRQINMAAWRWQYSAAKHILWAILPPGCTEWESLQKKFPRRERRKNCFVKKLQNGTWKTELLEECWHDCSWTTFFSWRRSSFYRNKMRRHCKWMTESSQQSHKFSVATDKYKVNLTYLDKFVFYFPYSSNNKL